MEVCDHAAVKDCLEQVLESAAAENTGTFATGYGLTNVPLPGLFVQGFGLLGLPLSETNAKQLVEFTHQAPFGKGGQTIVDTSVRNTWEINAAQILFKNPEWSVYIDKLLERVASELGIVGGQSSIRADLYKLLLYEEGSFFDKHQDSEKDHGMFGTLVIALPSYHTGGDVEATFKGEQKTLRTELHSMTGYSYLAWYSDVHHEVKKVTSGNRLVLTYNLIHTSGATEIRNTPTTTDVSQQLERFLQKWESVARPVESSMPHYMTYLLEHKYTDANLRLNHLKGRDRAMAGVLDKAVQDNTAAVYLANLEHVIDGGGYEDYGSGYSSDVDENGHHLMDEVTDEKSHLRLVVRLDGTHVATEVDISVDNIVQEDPFDKIPDEEDYSGYTGNEGTHVTHFYRKSAFIVMPKELETDFVFKLGKDEKMNLENWLAERLSDYQLHPSQIEFDRIVRLCNLAIEELKNPSKPPPRLGMFSWGYGSSKPRYPLTSVLRVVLIAASELNLYELFERAALQVKSRFEDSVYTTIGRTLRTSPFELWRKGIELCLQPLEKVHEKHGAIAKICQYMEENCEKEQNKNEVKMWSTDLLFSQIKRIEYFETSDAEALVKLAEVVDEKYIFDPILESAKKHLSNRSFVIEFANQIAESKKLRAEVAKNVFHDVLFNIASDFDLTSMGPTNKSAGWRSYTAMDRNISISSSPLEGSQIGAFVSHALQFGFFKPVVEILERVVKFAATTEIGNMITSVVKLLAPLSLALKSNSIPLTPDDNASIPLDMLKKLYHTALERYFRIYVKTRPREPTDWVRNQVRCFCDDCAHLNAFLRNPVQQTGRFPMGAKRRAHLHGQIGSYTTCTHETEHVGNPHSLIVTKNQGEYRKALAAFEERLMDALKDIGSIDIEVLQAMLGDGIQLPLSGCRWVQEAMEGSSAPIREISHNVATRVAPKVTEAVGPSGRVVIDLT